MCGKVIYCGCSETGTEVEHVAGCTEQRQTGYLEEKQGKEAQALRYSSFHILSLVQTSHYTHPVQAHKGHHQQ